MARWLVKSEPFKYSWDRMVADGRTHWDGVRNHQASANLKAMKTGDRAFFYHSNEGKEIVGVVEIVREYYPDPSDEKGRFGMVDVAPVAAVKRPVTLAEIKADPALEGIALVRQSRLSVMPVSDEHWDHICRLAGIEPGV
ncbi:MAG: EVE domain-containing protein [Tistrella sp.]|jgi:predicted RNA-binding protein with PUA-like domain|uniref:EVE domain-containing protein n=1 Tax=Tistrella mobilis TaxID=171437 RepID=A0A162LG72_9PROT|nr:MULTISPECIES: EVE domain-containing protein [Tistrella]KYO54824.1 ubiquinol-cytochrome C reductase [Tistrella mobilis]MAD38021.1 EVE domain-containing protein [Tistrella sp.]MAM72350.1 EVE domain-containing protein [Tistrella sp.]MBA78393.1 EVE domain-containing protein [Tistrella sp.]HAE50754.1 EVE domain-containing protein [Tistrella mobilis]|tara:strand:- start:2330 stop:2749 length:420 start_codon:yes stop_codon:yes gene_type:complete